MFVYRLFKISIIQLNLGFSLKEKGMFSSAKEKLIRQSFNNRKWVLMANRPAKTAKINNPLFEKEKVKQTRQAYMVNN